MLTVTTRDMLNNYYPWRQRGHSWLENVSLKSKATSRSDPATNQANVGRDCAILAHRGDWLPAGTVHSQQSLGEAC